MVLINALLGIFMIGLGFLVKAYPNLIAGYNTMSKEKKQQVDIAGLASMMRDSFIVLGLVIIGITFLLKLIDSLSTLDWVIPLVIVVGVVAMAIKAQKYDHN